jgi:hypothetical protein
MRELRALLFLLSCAILLSAQALSPSTESQINILGYGAKCDGTTDDSWAIQQALFAGAAANQPVYGPPATCLFNPPLYMDLQYNEMGPQGANGHVWSAGSTYRATGSYNDAVTYMGNAYVSIQDNNVGNPPNTSPTWWRLFAWSNTTTYALNDVVQYPNNLGSANCPTIAAPRCIFIPWLSLQAGNVGHPPAYYTYTGTEYWTPWAINPQMSFQTCLIGPRGQSTGEGGFELKATTEVSPLLIISAGNQNCVQNLTIQAGYQGFLYGQLNPHSIGIAISGGNFGNQQTLIENVSVKNARYCYMTGFLSGSLAADNQFNNVSGLQCDTMFWIPQTQNDVNTFIHPVSGYSRIFLNCANGKDCLVLGGNGGLQQASTGGAYGLSGTTVTSFACTDAANTVFMCYRITGTVTAVNSESPTPSPCSTFFGTATYGPRYDSFTLLTPSFGVVPFVMESFNASTCVGTFHTFYNWGGQHFYNDANVLANTNLTAELQGPSISTINSASCTGTTVTMGTSAPHGLTIGSRIPITTTGFNPAGYNVSGVLGTVTGASSFTWPLASGGTTCPGALVTAGTLTQTLYAAERLYEYVGANIKSYGVFAEQDGQSCIQLLQQQLNFNSGADVVISGMQLNADPGATNLGPLAYSPSFSYPGANAIYLCQHAFPFIEMRDNGFVSLEHIDAPGARRGTGVDPGIIDILALGGGNINFNDSPGFTSPNCRVTSAANGIGIGGFPFTNTGRGNPIWACGRWDRPPWIAQDFSTTSNNPQNYFYYVGNVQVPFLGYFPDPNFMPNMSPDLFTGLQLTPPQGAGGLGFGNYPIIYSGPYKTFDQFTGSVPTVSCTTPGPTCPKLWAMSSPQFGGSYGVNLSATNVQMPLSAISCTGAGVVTATTQRQHFYPQGQTLSSLTISGNTLAGYNVTAAATITSLTQFTYTASGATCPVGTNSAIGVVGGTWWSYTGQSFAVHMDAGTLGKMQNGLRISLNAASVTTPYLVTCVEPQLGFICVNNAAQNSLPSLTAGTKGTTYTCPGNCATQQVGQQLFTWIQP